MLIRYGYEITINCPRPTPIVCLLSVSEDRKADIRVAEKVFTTPIIPNHHYLDTFGNRCRRLVAPAGSSWLQRNKGARRPEPRQRQIASVCFRDQKRHLLGRTEVPPRRQGERELMAETVLF